MPARAEVRVSLVPLSETRGAWCGPCALPSAVEVVVAGSVNDRPMSLTTWRWCADCGHVERV